MTSLLSWVCEQDQLTSQPLAGKKGNHDGEEWGGHDPSVWTQGLGGTPPCEQDPHSWQVKKGLMIGVGWGGEGMTSLYGHRDQGAHLTEA